jgi:hypothetical protein
MPHSTFNRLEQCIRRASSGWRRAKAWNNVGFTVYRLVPID